MQGIGTVVGLFAVIIFFIIAGEQGGLIQNTTSLAPTSTPERSETSFANETQRNETPTTITAPVEQPPETTKKETVKKLSDHEIEKRLVKLYKELDDLEEDVRVAKLHEPVSPYANKVTLRAKNVRTDESDREYLTLTANSQNETGIPISDWYVKSYVTEERAALPDGARVLEHFRSTKSGPVILLPGETAYLLTGEKPLRVSFHENKCSGYLTEHADFYPSLRRECPKPIDEMLDFSSVKLDDDACYDYVEKLRRCATTEDVIDVSELDLPSRCDKFLEEELSYNSCVENHKNDPLFDDVGYWYLYFDRDEELWRSEREIIRLMDGDDRVIDVIEY